VDVAAQGSRLARLRGRCGCCCTGVPGADIADLHRRDRGSGGDGSTAFGPAAGTERDRFRGQRVATRVTGAVNAARRAAGAGIEAGKTLAGVTGLWLDAAVVPCHSDKQGAGPNFKGFGHHPAAGLLRQHHRAAGRDAAPKAAPSPTRWPITWRSGYQRAAPAALAAADGHLRRRRGQPRPDLLPGQAGGLDRSPAHLLVGYLGKRRRTRSPASPGMPGRSPSVPWRGTRAPRRRRLRRYQLRPPHMLGGRSPRQ